ncbi:ABC transporter permease [Propionivibrio limicola]|uniref:ABC transporter permease n=1 Tax=Propionivibrio limicola TaxID=167645 RepID=UPI001FE8B098|nr:ABC transporter permease [Propionivibrio limicola]
MKTVFDALRRIPVMRRTPASLTRLKALVRKEFLQIVRDPSSIAIAFLMPLFLLLLFGYGVSLDTEHVPVAFVAEQPSADTDDFRSSLLGSRYFAIATLRTLPEAEQALREGRVNAIVRLRANFSERLRRADGAPIQIIVNGVDANTAQLTLGYLEGAWGNWLTRRVASRGGELTAPVQLEQRVWFNSELKSRNFLVPGLVAIVMTLIGTLLTALVMAREWERGTLEALLVTPTRMSEILLGKIIAYFTLGTGGMLISVGLAVWLFGVPLRGSFWLLWTCASLFLLAALGMGLAISTVARNQFVAGQLAIVGTFLPAFLLSGFIFDIDSMPAAVQGVTHVIVARYFVTIVQTLFLAGDVWSVVLPNALALLAMAAFFLAVTWRKSRKRLE